MTVKAIPWFYVYQCLSCGKKWQADEPIDPTIHGSYSEENLEWSSREAAKRFLGSTWGIGSYNQNYKHEAQTHECSPSQWGIALAIGIKKELSDLEILAEAGQEFLEERSSSTTQTTEQTP